MKNIKRTIFGFIIVAMGVLVGQLCCSNVFAEGGGAVFIPGPSSEPISGGGAGCGDNSDYSYSNQWRTDCAGASWIYYEVLDTSRAASLVFPYITGNHSNVTVPAECAKHENGGFWHLGSNLRGADIAWLYDSEAAKWKYVINPSKGVYGHWSTRQASEFPFSSNYNKPNNGSLNQVLSVSLPRKNGDGGPAISSLNVYQSSENPDKPLYRATAYLSGAEDGYKNKEGSRENVVRDFIAAYKEEYGVELSDTEAEQTMYNMNLGIFCWWSGMGNNPEYFTKSAVVIDENNEPKDATTGISSAAVSDGVKVEVKKEGYAEGETATVKFTPNIYASTKVEDNKEWIITRSFSNEGDSSNFEIEVIKGSSGETESGSTSLLLECQQGSDTYYVANDCDHIREDEYKITFKAQGEITICESIEIKDEDRKTTACATLTANQNNEYLAKSNVAIRGGAQEQNFDTTGVTSHGEAKVFEDNVEANSERTIVFSHNIYSTRQVKEIEWGFEREGFDGVGYEILESTLCPTPWYSSNKADFNEMESAGSDRVLYAGDPYINGQNARRTCTDEMNSEGQQYYYIVREVYKMKFTEEGKTYKFCEKISVDGAEKTVVCAEIITKGGDGTPPPPDLGECGKWTPSSYTLSSETAGWTSVVAKVVNWNRSVNTDWVDSTYARPDDLVNWIFCYYPGVQRTWETDATNNHISESSGHPDDSYSLTYQALYLFGHPWENKFSIAAIGNFAPDWKPWLVTAGIGDDSVKDRKTNYTIEKGVGKNKAGNTLVGQIKSGVPTYASVTNKGPHSWKCHWSEDDCENCGDWCCGGYSTDDDGKRSCDGWCCRSCYKDICEHTEDYIAHTITNVAAVDNADVKIPFNFNNSTVVSLDRSPVYAGEIVKISNLTVRVGTKRNDVTKDTYATHVENAKVKLVAYLSLSGSGSPMESEGSGRNYNICSSLAGVTNKGKCDELDVLDGVTMNEVGNLGGYTENYTSDFGEKYSVYDDDAGKYFCVVSAVYPANSDDDTNLDPAGSDSWYISAPACSIIAKKPSFQVRGGSTLTEGNISTYTSEKNNIDGLSGDYSYTPTNHGTTVVFGSWAEQSVVANGVVAGGNSLGEPGTISKGYASGAATGMTGSVERATTNYCGFRVPISFANYYNKIAIQLCTSMEQVGQSGISIGGNKNAFASYWYVENSATYAISGNSVNLGSSAGYKDVSTVQGDKVRYTYKRGALEIMNTEVLGAGITHVVRVDAGGGSNGNITITSDLKYNNGTYNDVSFIPKMIIYAQGDIKINCNVGRIDAILIAEGTVDTCANASSDLNDANRSKQLIINGAVMASNLILGRTYGAGAGRASAIPAEIINYDTSSVLWGRRTAEGDDSATMNIVYQHELAPRY